MERQQKREDCREGEETTHTERLIISYAGQSLPWETMLRPPAWSKQGESREEISCGQAREGMMALIEQKNMGTNPLFQEKIGGHSGVVNEFLSARSVEQSQKPV